MGVCVPRGDSYHTDVMESYLFDGSLCALRWLLPHGCYGVIPFWWEFVCLEVTATTLMLWSHTFLIGVCVPGGDSYHPDVMESYLFNGSLCAPRWQLRHWCHGIIPFWWEFVCLEVTATTLMLWSHTFWMGVCVPGGDSYHPDVMESYLFDGSLCALRRLLLHCYGNILF